MKDQGSIVVFFILETRFTRIWVSFELNFGILVHERRAQDSSIIYAGAVENWHEMCGLYLLAIISI